jgi:hypothetical protein
MCDAANTFNLLYNRVIVGRIPGNIWCSIPGKQVVTHGVQHIEKHFGSKSSFAFISGTKHNNPCSKIVDMLLFGQLHVYITCHSFTHGVQHFQQHFGGKPSFVFISEANHMEKYSTCADLLFLVIHMYL